MKEQSKLGLASMIIGIVSLLISCTGLGIIGILGVIFSIIVLSQKDKAKGMAIAGLITSVIAVLFSVFIIWVEGTTVSDDLNVKTVEDGDVGAKTENEKEKIVEKDKTEDGSKEKDDIKEEERDSKTNIGDGLERITSGEYLFITNEDLDKYCANMVGAKIYVVTEVDDIKEDMIQSNLSEKYMMSNFHVGENYRKYESKLKKGDVVAISGTVAGNDGYSFMGKSVNVEDCLVFAVGEKAEEHKKESSDEGLSQYFTVTEEVADSSEDISEGEYKSLCETLDYEDILRNPDNNDGKYCKVEGTAEQVVEGWFGSFTIYVADYNGNKWGCVYSYKDGESRILEGDSVVLYGKCKGTDTAETLLGEQVTLPRVDVEYIN